jgi:hypothetical protein
MKTNVPPPGRFFTRPSCAHCSVMPWGEIELCSLHASAPALLEALEYIMDSANYNLMDAATKARVAIRAAKGGTRHE